MTYKKVIVNRTEVRGQRTEDRRARGKDQGAGKVRRKEGKKVRRK
jgi:hypothetical protein